MGGVRFAELRSRPREVLECTSVTRDEFPPLGPPFEAAFRARLTAGRLEGKPRTARRVSVDQHGPLPPPDDRLLCILVSLKTSALQVVQGRVCGMLQGNAKPWLHGLLPTLRAALRPRGAAPARSLTARAQRRGVSEADAASGGSHTRSSHTRHGARLPPWAHDGTARRIGRPQEAAEQAQGESGKTKAPPVHHVLLVNALPTMLLLSDTHGGRVHARR